MLLVQFFFRLLIQTTTLSEQKRGAVISFGAIRLRYSPSRHNSFVIPSFKHSNDKMSIHISHESNTYHSCAPNKCVRGAAVWMYGNGDAISSKAHNTRIRFTSFMWIFCGCVRFLAMAYSHPIYCCSLFSRPSSSWRTHEALHTYAFDRVYAMHLIIIFFIFVHFQGKYFGWKCIMFSRVHISLNARIGVCVYAVRSWFRVNAHDSCINSAADKRIHGKTYALKLTNAWVRWEKVKSFDQSFFFVPLQPMRYIRCWHIRWKL